jgi:hypothetical protein
MYGEILTSTDPFPLLLPKFALLITYRERASVKSEIITLRVTGPPNDTTLLWEMSQELNRTPPPWPVDQIEAEDLDIFIGIRVPVVFAPLVISEPGAIKVRAYRDGVQIKLGALLIMKTPTTQVPTPDSSSP